MTKRFKIHQENLDKLFYPKSIAVIGVTNIEGTVPYDILENIIKAGYNGVVYPVSQKERSICSVKAYKNINDIEAAVDLAILVIPSPLCPRALEQCGIKGIKAAIVISAGFKEIGEKGIAREKQLIEIAEKYNISFIGPNCLGVINTDPISNLNASFARKMPEEGSIGFLSQSGALCTAVLDYAKAKHIGFSKFISFGNKADISEVDLMYYLMKDVKTKVILVYLEEISDGRALMDVSQEIIKKSGKPVLIIKSGRTLEGASAAASHTGSLAGSDDICDAAFKQAGIIRCNHIEEMFNIATAFVYQPIPISNKIAIITNAGGPGVLTTDASIKENLQLAKFSDETRKKLKRHLPSTANINNPVDVIGDARSDRYNAAINATLNDDEVAGVFVILTPQSMTDIEVIAKEIIEVAKAHDKPVYTSFMGEADVAGGVDMLQKNKIPHYHLPESMSRSFAATYHFKQLLTKKNSETKYFEVNKKNVQTLLKSASKKEKTYLYEEEAVKVLKSYGMPIMSNGMANNPEEAIKIAKKIGFPVVMKIMSQDIVHKFDVKGVVLNINSSEEVQIAYNSIIKNVKELKAEAKIEGVFVTKMIPKGEELIMGLKQDPSFGPVIMFGLGGVFVEIFKDTSFKIAPLSDNDIGAMIKEVKAYKILQGTRGNERRDIKCIKEMLMRLSQLAMDFPQIKELDMNPVIALEDGKGCFVADAKIML
ncbi:MAG: acetate--CoA ligase family protein [Bacteroidota bacterium]